MAQFPFKDFITSLKNGTGKALRVTTEEFPEYRILSTDPMPVAKMEEKGAQLIIMDTGDIYFNHGGKWEVF